MTKTLQFRYWKTLCK